MRTTSHPVHLLPPLQHLPSLPLIYPLPFPPLLQSPPQTPPKTRKLLEAINRNTEFLWPNGIGLLELQGPYRLLQYPFVPNNNDFDEILNGPRGEIAPSTRPPNTSPKQNWAPTDDADETHMDYGQRFITYRLQYRFFVADRNSAPRAAQRVTSSSYGHSLEIRTFAFAQ